MKIRVNKIVPLSVVSALTEDERSAINELRKKLEKDITESELQSQVYEIARNNRIEPKKFFNILYQMLLNKESGPKLGPFILAIGKEKISKLLEVSSR